MKTIVSKIKLFVKSSSVFVKRIVNFLWALIIVLAATINCTNKNSTKSFKDEQTVTTETVLKPIVTEVTYNIKYHNTDIRSNVVETKVDTIVSEHPIKLVHSVSFTPELFYITNGKTVSKQITDIHAANAVEITPLYQTAL